MPCTITNDFYTIENQYIRKDIFLENNCITGFKFSNKLSSSQIKSGPDSKEFELRFKSGFKDVSIVASELKVEMAKSENTVLCERLIISFEPFKIKDSKVKLTAFYELSPLDRFIKKYFELSFAEKGSKDVHLDYIDFEQFRFPVNVKKWCLPEQKSSHIPGFALSLGQPVYVDSFYFGCEFPAALTTINGNTTTSKYFSGKTLVQLIGSENKYTTYKYVSGVADGDIFEQVQKAFYSYIRTISKSVYLRRQYNSWYDNMLNITNQNVSASFFEVEKGLTKYGEKPLDSYVVDDGWNDYSAGFWSFNSKFPDKLFQLSHLSENLGSRFGVWVGPRGGYTNDTIKFAKKIQKAENGFVNKYAKDICVCSDKYSSKTGNMMLSFQRDFHLNYFKLDGFAQRACKTKKHDHMTGGYNQMYFYTDLWEKWLKIFDEMYEKGDDSFWINLTCYAPPSPWFLKHVHSLWMQVSDDIGFIGKKGEGSDKDRCLSYRDEKYFDFYSDRQFQFPQRCLYNHDPIYGNEAKIEMSDDDFRDYLFTMATRGTSFWELYYSHNLMNENKWRINYSAMRFIEDNLDTLSNSVIFGTKPSLFGVYGYSCFGEYEGIVCLRNSSAKKTSYTLKLDEKIGVSKNYTAKSMTVILPYTTEQSDDIYGYGDELEISLEPFQSRIFHFGKVTKPMAVTWARAKDKNTLEITFNQMVNISDISCEKNPVKDCKLLEDYMTAVVTFRDDFSRQNELDLTLRDIMGTEQQTDVAFDYYEDHKVLYGLWGDRDFSIRATLEDENPNTIVKQGDELELKVGEDGHIYFRVGIDEIKSRSTVKDVVLVTAVRERNGVLKLYLNGKLDSGATSLSTFLSGENAYCYDSGKVTIYNKALAFDEV